MSCNVDNSYDWDGENHRADMADLRNSAAAADAHFTCGRCGEPAVFAQLTELSMCCGWERNADRPKDAAPVAASEGLPPLLRVPATDVLERALIKALRLPVFTAAETREMEALRLQLVMARVCGRAA